MSSYDQYVPALDDRFESIVKEGLKNCFFFVETEALYRKPHSEQKSLDKTRLCLIWSLDFNMGCLYSLRR